MSALFNEHLRLCLLRFLLSAPSYRANSSILHQVADTFGLSATRDQIKAQLAWLKEQSLVETEELMGLVVASLTERGQDVAGGRATCPGVQRPGPKSA